MHTESKDEILAFLKSTARCLSFPHVGITVFGHYEILRNSLI